MTRLLSSEHISCSECEHFKWAASFPCLGICENMDVEHYGHSLAKFHQACGGFSRKKKQDPTATVMVAQRLFENDPTEYILKQEKEEP